ncbi:NUDIX domain-containing protein [Halobacterium sp. R2-5]|uniref:NUDIX hydrolase n=1 Tax=Halobacterium sp. R2-5 TaxID=2715751 RepID=UPI00142393F1|nr:NUDIX domain-containing protein [Halobacterium sp. R2-5]NIB99599.1 NUDIX domain-containing protein [Halobacterium sp. R2-5]
MTDEPLRATVTQRGVLFSPVDGDVLVVRRDSDGGWELPGGRLDSDETARAGVWREIREETALDADVVTPVDTLAWHNDDGDGRFAVYYYCRADDRTVSLSPEHDDHEWLPPADACRRLSDPQAAAVDAAIAAREAAVEAE